MRIILPRPRHSRSGRENGCRIQTIGKQFTEQDLPVYLFLFPLLAGFLFNWASAPTAFYIRRLGETRGRALTFLFRNILGIPVWAAGLALACRVDVPALWPDTVLPVAAGWVLICAGGLLILQALRFLGWRSVRPTSQDSLVQSGSYRWVRHPIHAGVLLEFLGVILLFRTAPVLAACLLGSLYVVVQTKLEEADLLARIPDYRQYMQSVPRFLPRFRELFSRPR
jgi:protein-S-isoprenylcysteine O-methyltransferase Ste14